MGQEAPVDRLADDYDLAAVTALALREAQAAGDAVDVVAKRRSSVIAEWRGRRGQDPAAVRRSSR